MKTTVGSDHTPGTIFKIPFGSIGDGYLTITDSGCIPVLYQVTANINGSKYVYVNRTSDKPLVGLEVAVLMHKILYEV